MKSGFNSNLKSTSDNYDNNVKKKNALTVSAANIGHFKDFAFHFEYLLCMVFFTYCFILYSAQSEVIRSNIMLDSIRFDSIRLDSFGLDNKRLNSIWFYILF